MKVNPDGIAVAVLCRPASIDDLAVTFTGKASEILICRLDFHLWVYYPVYMAFKGSPCSS